MVVRKCHFLVAAFLMCLLSCKANDARLVDVDESGPEHSLVSSSSAPEASVTGPNVKPDSGASSTISTKPQGATPEPTIPLLSTPSAAPQVETTTPAKAELPQDKADTTLPPIPTPSTIKPDPDPKPTEKPTTSSTEAPTTTPTKTTPPPTTASPPTSTSTSPPTPTTSITPTTASSPTTPKSNGTTVTPVTTPQPAPHHSRQFDGPSFIGGIVLATGLMAIGFVAFKFYKARTERNYHTL